MYFAHCVHDVGKLMCGLCTQRYVHVARVMWYIYPKLDLEVSCDSNQYPDDSLPALQLYMSTSTSAPY